MKHISTLLLAIFLASLSWSQESEDPDDTTVEASEETQAAGEQDDSDLDEQGYGEEDEDDFVPSQDVTADQNLPFPVDI
ncbi:MAG: hypothetical protein ACE5OQ_13640 [Woeseia sp.]